MSTNETKTIKLFGLPIGVVVILGILLGGGGWWFFLRGNDAPSLPSANQVAPTPPAGQPQIANAPEPVRVNQNVQTPTVAGSFVIEGSTSLNELGVALTNDIPGIRFNATGSSDGIAALLNGRVDMAASSRELTDSEKSQGLVQHVIGSDSVAFMVSASNRTAPNSLDRYQLRSILSGEVTDWSQVGGDPGEIKLIVRGDGGTKDTIEDAFELNGFSPNATYLAADSTTDVINSLGSTGIGFGTTGQVINQQTVRVIQIENEAPTSSDYIGQRYVYFVTFGQPDAQQKSVIDYAAKVYAQRFSPIR